MWTVFRDMNSGGSRKHATLEVVAIEADEDEAAEMFKARLGIYPYGETCRCCGPDYSIRTTEELNDIQDGVFWRYSEQAVLVIRKSEFESVDAGDAA